MLKSKGILAILSLLGLFIVLHLAFVPAQHTPRTTGTTMLGGIAFLLATTSIFLSTRISALPFKIEAVNAMERATEVVLKPLADALNHKPRQFAFVEIQGKDWSEPHPFTISSAPNEENLRFTIKVLGDWTRKVREELTVGGEVLVRGPYGCFDTHGAGNKQIWLAGGVGLTPFLSMMRAMQPGDERNIHLVYAARDENDAIFLEELKARAKELGNVTIVPLFSDEGNFARVDVMKTKLPDPLNTYEYFMCGPKPMTEALMKGLKEEGVQRQQIHTEAFEFR